MKVPSSKGGLTGPAPANRERRPQAASLEAGKIERSAEAFQVRHHLNSFPPMDNPKKAVAWIDGPGEAVPGSTIQATAKYSPNAARQRRR
jgi:hypothetical protein